jgi:hypothetical protein
LVLKVLVLLHPYFSDDSNDDQYIFSFRLRSIFIFCLFISESGINHLER